MFVDVSAEELDVVMNKGYAEMCLCVGWGWGGWAKQRKIWNEHFD